MHRVRNLILMAVVGLASGCVFTIPTNPDTYPAAAADFPMLPPGTAVEIANRYSASYFAKMDGNVQGDLREFTQTAVVILGRALEKKGAAVAPGARKIVLEVTSVSRAQGMGTQRASVSLEAELGSSKVSAWGEAAGLDMTRNFSAAISHAVDDLLRKAELREYLSKP